MTKLIVCGCNGKIIAPCNKFIEKVFAFFSYFSLVIEKCSVKVGNIKSFHLNHSKTKEVVRNNLFHAIILLSEYGLIPLALVQVFRRLTY